MRTTPFGPGLLAVALTVVSAASSAPLHAPPAAVLHESSAAAVLHESSAAAVLHASSAAAMPHESSGAMLHASSGWQEDVQDPAPAGDPDRLQGRLYLGDLPADTGTVVLHAVNPETAGAIDSVRVGPAGRFEFDLTAAPPLGSGQSIFVTHRRDGVLYYGSPIVTTSAIPEEYPVRAYPARRVPEGGPPLVVEQRTIVIEDGPGVWRVTDMIRVHNDSSVTWVAADAEGAGADGRTGAGEARTEAGEGRTEQGDGRTEAEDGRMPAAGRASVWRYPLPPSSTSPRLVQGAETGVERVRFEDATLHVSGAVPPGDRVYVVQYDLPSLDASVPLAGPTQGVELLVDPTVPSLEVVGMTPGEPFEAEGGVVYRRWWAEEGSDRVVRIRPGPEDGSPGPAGVWFGIGMALVLIVGGAWLVRREEDGRPEGAQS